jgi:hypothetical protein
MCIENYEENFGSFNETKAPKNASMELLIELHYQLSDMNTRLNEFDFSFLQQILFLSETEIRRQMALK